MPITVFRDKQRKTLNVTVDELDLDAEQGATARHGETERSRPSTGFGMDVDAMTPEMARELELPRGRGGAIVTRVERNSPAANAGVAPNDVILEVNRQPVTSVAPGDPRAAEGAPPGETVFLLVWRDGQQVFVR